MTGGGAGRVSHAARWRGLALCLMAGLFLAALQPAAAQGVGPDEVLADPALETRARALSKRLRCLVCQNQSIDDSDAPLARDLRILVRERLKAGDSDAEVVGFLTRRYGDYVLLKPPVKPKTWVLWFGPPLVLGLAVVAIFLAMRIRRRIVPAGPAPLSPAEKERLARILEGAQDGEGSRGEQPKSGQGEGR